MNQPFSNVDAAIARTRAAIEAMRQGRGILVVDDLDRENEGDLIFAADTLTVPQMAMLIRECSGIVCLCLTEEKARQLELPPMVAVNTCKNGTAFTVTIEAAKGATTGVSALGPPPERRRRVVSRPSSSGMRTSMKMTSKRLSSQRFNAAMPSAAAAMSQPSG